MVGCQMYSMSNHINYTNYGEPVMRGSSVSSERQIPNIPPNLTGNNSSWKGSIWGNGGFELSGFGRNNREPLAVRENNSEPAFQSLNSFAGYESLISSSEVEGRPRNVPEYYMPRGSDGLRSKYDSLLATTDMHLQNANSRSAYSSDVLSRASNSMLRDQSLSRLSTKGPGNAGHILMNSSRSTAISPSELTDATASSWNEQISPTESQTSVTKNSVSSRINTSRSGSLPPSRHGNEPTSWSTSLELLGPSRQGSRASVQAPFVTLTRPSSSSFNRTLPLLQKLSIGDDDRLSINSFDSSTNVKTYPASFDGARDSNGPVLLPNNSSRPLDAPLDNRLAMRNGVQLGRHGESYARHQDFIPSGHPFSLPAAPTTHHGSTAHFSESAKVGNHRYPHSSRNFQPANHIPSKQMAVLETKRMKGMQESQRLYNPQMQQFVASAQANRQSNAIGYQLPNPTPMNAYSGSMSMPTFQPSMPPYDSSATVKDQDSGTAVRSTLMQEFKSNSRSNKRYDLKDIYDHIAEFSGDQHGSRFIQQKLETATSEEKERVFQEIQPNSMQLTCDVFGNYVIQKFFEHGDQNQKKLLANRMRGHVLSLSLQTYACRVVQKALEHILVDQQISIVKELEHHVIKCVKDQNGNHVIQKAIERLPSENVQFIIDSFAGQVQSLAAHSYGCRVIQRLLEHAREPARSAILRELHVCVPSLISDQFGNYVTQHMIEHGGPNDRSVIISMIHNNLLSFATHKFASNVVEKGLVYASDKQRHDMMVRLLKGNDQGDGSLGKLIRCGYGNYVLQKFLDTLDPTDYVIFVEALQPELQRAKQVTGGNGIKNIPAIEKKMRRPDTPVSCPHDSGMSFGTLSNRYHPNNNILPTTIIPCNSLSVGAI